MCGRLYRDQDPDDDPGETWKGPSFDGETLRAMNDVFEQFSQPNYNVAPGTVQPAIVLGKQGLRWVKLQWGLVSRHGGSIMPSNARSESIFDKPMFRDLIGTRRCIVPTSGYYEWQGRQPYYLTSADGQQLALAAIYDTTHTLDGAVGSYAVVTTTPNPEIAFIHNRMPVILPDAAAREAWLSHGVRDRATIQSLMTSYPAEKMRWWPVSRKVNNAKNNDPSLIAPLDGPSEPTQAPLFG